MKKNNLKSEIIELIPIAHEMNYKEYRTSYLIAYFDWIVFTYEERRLAKLKCVLYSLLHAQKQKSEEFTYEIIEIYNSLDINKIIRKQKLNNILNN